MHQRTIAGLLAAITVLLVIVTLAGCGHSPDKGWHWRAEGLLYGLHESNSDPGSDPLPPELRP